MELRLFGNFVNFVYYYINYYFIVIFREIIKFKLQTKIFY